MFIPYLDAIDLLERFFISAVVALLGLRFYLYITGFPQVGSGKLHVAHMLWGGLLMVVALLVLINFLDRTARKFAAIIAGLGFGIFIDELGKFLTRDADYFYQPTVAIIYVVFVLLYLAIRGLTRHPRASDNAYVANAFEHLKEASVGEDPMHHVVRARHVLERVAPDHPAGRAAEAAISSFHGHGRKHRGPLRRMELLVRNAYHELLHTEIFRRSVIALFVVLAIGSVVESVTVTARKVGYTNPLELIPHIGSVPIERSADIFCSLAAALFVLAGVIMLKPPRMDAYRMFRIAILISLFLTQFFVFYDAQFFALIGVAIDVVVLATLDYTIRLERLHSAPGRHEELPHTQGAGS